MAEVKNEASFMDEFAGQGFDHLSPDAFARPFIKIAQPLSPECMEGEKNAIPGLKPGMFFNTLTRKVYGNKLKLVPVYVEELWLLWTPKDQGGGFKGSVVPFSVPHTGDEFGAMKTEAGLDIQPCITFYGILPDDPSEGPVALPLTSTGLRHGKNWNSALRLTKLPSGKPCPFFGGIWELTLELNKNDKGLWYQIGQGKATNAKFISYVPEVLFRDNALPAYNALREKRSTDYAALESSPERAQIEDATSKEY